MSGSTSDTVVRKHRVGRLEVWTLSRPEARNAISVAMLEALLAAAHDASADETLRAVVLTGEGDKAFCAGADLKERALMSEAAVHAFLDLFRSVLERIEQMPVPVIAAINGAALGGGLELALACDIRIASKAAKVGLPEVTLGIIPGAGGTQRLPRIVGHARAKELIITGQLLNAEAALQSGLVNHLCAEGATVLNEALQYGEKYFAHGAPIAIRSALAAVDAARDTELVQGLDVERKFYEKTLHSQDRLEALAAFKDHRKPRFEGR